MVTFTTNLETLLQPVVALVCVAQYVPFTSKSEGFKAVAEVSVAYQRILFPLAFKFATVGFPGK